MESNLTWIEISKSALHYNIRQFRHVIGPNVKLYPVIKANAYGHGLSIVAREVIAAGVDGVAVDSLEEAIEVRRQHESIPIVILGYILAANEALVASYKLEPVVYNEISLLKLEAEAERCETTISIHLKLETGTNRQGILSSQIQHFCELIKGLPHIHLKGILTHFANIEDTTEHNYAEGQVATFETMRKQFIANGFPDICCHSACTAAAILFPQTYYDLVRVGIGIYGLWPSKETYLSALMKFHRTLTLKPVMTWKTRIAQIKIVPSDSFVGYGCTYRTTRSTTLAILPIGYYDGYDRHFSNAAHVLIHGKRAPIRGRICMNICMADVTDIPDTHLEDEVVLLGRQEQDEITAEFLASLSGSINYEIISRINPLLPRIIVD